MHECVNAIKHEFYFWRLNSLKRKTTVKMAGLAVQFEKSCLPLATKKNEIN
jgi:hypothetical protein